MILKRYIGILASLVLLVGTASADVTKNNTPTPQDHMTQMGNMGGGMTCCGPGMMGMMDHGTMAVFSVLGAVLILSISSAFVALAVFLFRRSRRPHHQ